MKILLRFIVLTPIAVVVLAFAYANRHVVTISFDPFAANDAFGIPAVSAPLFVVLFLAVMIGVLAGGAATWLAQRKHRKAARDNRAEAERLRAQTATPQSAENSDRGPPGARLQHRA